MADRYVEFDLPSIARGAQAPRRKAGLVLIPAALLLLPGPAFAAQESHAGAQPPGISATAPAARSPASELKARTAPVRLPTLTTAEAVHNLTPAQAKLHYPVHLRAICTVCFTGWHGFFVNDGVAGVYVETKNHVLLTAAIHPGTYLEIEGVTGPGEYAPVVDQSTLRILGERPLPPAREVSLETISTGVEDGQWIAFEGIVRSAVVGDPMLTLTVVSGRWQIEVNTPAGKADYGRLIDARVRIRGAAGPVFNQRRQLIGVNSYTPGLDYIEILQPAPTDPFSLPLKQLRSVFEYTPGARPDQLVRIRGIVTARWGQTVFIYDGDQGAGVLSRETNNLKPGDEVDAVGYPALGETAHTLDDAIFRRLGAAPLPEPRVVTVKEALSGDFEGDVVRLNGRLIEQKRDWDQDTLLVDAGGTVFSAILPGELKEQPLAGLRDGSQIQLTGVCIISDTQASRHFRLPKAFEILLRSPSDVAVIESPPWWTPSHAFLVLAFALTGTLVVLTWVVALKRRVRQQTILLRESEERFRHMALHDALTGLATRLLLQDRLDTALEAAIRHRTGLALLIVDLDKFKEINDSFGHQAGDEVLRATADRLLEAVRKTDTVARIGGDEFVVLLTDLHDAQIAERIAVSIVETLRVPILFQGGEVPATVSVGICSTAAGELDGAALFRGADAALYLAKASGRNCYRVFAPEGASVQTQNAG
jgi:diguanylate cyclase (GGDEF)-like protein